MLHDYSLVFYNVGSAKYAPQDGLIMHKLGLEVELK